MRTTLKGHSGAEITTDFNKVYKKVTRQSDYERLMLSAKKQASFVDGERIISSKFFELKPEDKTIIFNYIKNTPMKDFLKYDLKDISWFIDGIFSMIDSSLIKSNQEWVTMTRISNKLKSIEVNIKNNKNLSENVIGRSLICLDYVMELSMPSLLFPIGYCHGDLTFTNMLISDDSKCYLIDFLDSWIDSPLIDVAKLIQESEYSWLSRMGNLGDEDSKAIGSKTYNIVNSIVSSVLERHPTYFKALKASCIINDLRLLQYEKDIDWAERIIFTIERRTSWQLA